MTLNGVMAVTLRYFTEFGKPALQKTMCGGIYARDLYCVGGTLSLTQSIYCIVSECTMSSQRKFTFAISSPDEFLVMLSCRPTKSGRVSRALHPLPVVTAPGVGDTNLVTLLEKAIRRLT